MSDFVELVERDSRAEWLKGAKARALLRVAPADPGRRSWYITREQWARFRASSDPLTEYREETERFVASEYNLIRDKGSPTYREAIGDYHSWSPGGNGLFAIHPYGRGRWHNFTIWLAKQGFLTGALAMLAILSVLIIVWVEMQ